MRLTSLSLRSYGNFAAEDIVFDARPGVINLLVAPNGSGKSVLRNAFCDLLFGIGGQTPMGFRFGYSGMRLSADAVTRDGERFTFGRRKGQGNTLVDGEGNTLDPVTLARVLGRTDRSLLEQLFALDTPRLREGEERLLASNGALAAALISGAGGTRDAERLHDSLEAARDALAPMRRSSQRPFYVELEKFTASRRQLNSSTLKPELWEKLHRERDEARQQQTTQNERADVASAEIARLERIRRVAPWLAVHDEATAWLAAHADAPLLDASLTAQLTDTRHAIMMAEERATTSNEQAVQLADKLQSIVLDAPVLAVAAEIDRMMETAGAARKAAADLPGVQSELDAHQRRIAGLLRELGSQVAVADAARAIPTRAVLSRARRLIAAYREQVAATTAAQFRLAELTQGLAQIDTELAASPPGTDTQVLAALVEEIRSEGDPARRHQALAAALEDAEAAVSSAVLHVPGWTAGAQTLVDFAPLQATAYDRLAADLAAAGNEELNRRTQADAASDALAQAEQRLSAIARPGALVTEHDLNAARAHRDAGWQVIYRLAFTGDPPSAEEQARFAGESPLPSAFEHAVSAADAMADARMRDHAIIVQAELCHAAVRQAQAELEETQERHRIARETLDAATRAWTQVCSALPLGDAPIVSEVHAFLAARERVIDAMRTRTVAEKALRVVEQQQAIWQGQLAACLELPADHAMPLARLLVLAEQALKRSKDAATARTRIADRRQSAAEALAKERDKIAAATAEAADWQLKWQGVLAELGRPLDEEPDVTDELLQLMGEVGAESQTADALIARIEGMTADIQQFQIAANALVAAAAPDLQALPSFDAMAELNRRMMHQRGLEKQHALLRAQGAAAQESAAKAKSELADLHATLRSTLLLIGADSPEAAELRLALSAERRRQDMRLADAQARLHEAGHGHSVEQLKAEVAAVAFDDIELMIDRASRDRREANEAAQMAAAQVAQLDQQMERDAVAETANIAMMQQQAAAAAIGRTLDEALLLHVAAALLKRSLASVESASDNVVLRRISELFRTLTDDVFTRVYTVADEAVGPRLVLQERRFPDERKEVKELSEGTRDQLFLALRLAAIEEHALTAPPLPFIGDDILQTFDDDRSLATMRVLLQLSQQVQVILLTHHRHLLDLVEQLPHGSVHKCELSQVVAA